MKVRGYLKGSKLIGYFLSIKYVSFEEFMGCGFCFFVFVILWMIVK